MKKLLATLMLGASLCLSACGEASVSLDTVKNNLGGSGYNVTAYTQDEAKAAIKGINYNVEISGALYAVKSEGDNYFIAFFCANINDASAFVNENISAMYHWIEAKTEGEAKTGSHNNVAYAGTVAAVAAAGFPV